MTPLEMLLDETKQWVRRAQGDLRAAELCASELPTESLYHCQQCAEKLLKAFLTWHQISFRKTHELRELGEACEAIESSLSASITPAYELSKYAWLFRYPGAPYEPDPEEAKAGIQLAELVRNEILNRLPAGAILSPPLPSPQSP